MKYLLLSIAILFCSRIYSQQETRTNHLILITIDGCRWQEIFRGADSLLIRNENFVKDTDLATSLYWDADVFERRRKLMPFLWTVIQHKGEIWGNRLLGNKSDVRNIFKISYPGYNEILTGYADPQFIPNTPVNNPNTNLLEYLDNLKQFKGKVAAFTSWNIFPYILGRPRNKLYINSGYDFKDTADHSPQSMTSQVQQEIANKTNTRYDELTFLLAFDYLKAKKPAVLFLGFGETDEFAHHREYDSYLAKMNSIDKMISDLWYFVQTDPEYKDHTTLIITTDHGRGVDQAWHNHGTFTRGSGETWVAFMGPTIEPRGEMKTECQIYQNQLAATMAELLGLDWHPQHRTGRSILEIVGNEKQLRSAIPIASK